MAQHFGKWGGKTAEEHAAEPKNPEDTYVRLGDVLDYLHKRDDCDPALVMKVRIHFSSRKKQRI